MAEDKFSPEMALTVRTAGELASVRSLAFYGRLNHRPCDAQILSHFFFLVSPTGRMMMSSISQIEILPPHSFGGVINKIVMKYSADCVDFNAEFLLK